MRFLLLITTLMPWLLFAQDTASIMTYNVLNYPGSTGDIRDPHFVMLIDSIRPDILVVEEIIHTNGANRFRDSVMLKVDSNYAMATFINGPDTDRALFYKTAKFSFTNNLVIPTALRDINEFELTHNASGEVIYIYSVHLKASSGSTNQTKRANEIDSLRSVTEALPTGSNFIILGDFNIYGSYESAYLKLLDQAGPNEGYFIDVLEDSMSGSWNNSAYAKYHTQSPRTRSFGGGASGGSDDRFDMILFSAEIDRPGGVDYIPKSLVPIGNDGNHYNDSINFNNTMVSEAIADAIHYGADHIPVIARFSFEIPNALPVELIAWDASLEENNEVKFEWTTFTEIENSHFVIEHAMDAQKWNELALVEGAGNSAFELDYTAQYVLESEGLHYFRLHTVSFNGEKEYFDIISLSNKTGQEFSFYPNPTKGKIELTGIGRYESITVVNNLGQTELVFDNAIKTEFLKLDVSHLFPGGYYLVLNGESGIERRMFVKH